MVEEREEVPDEIEPLATALGDLKAKLKACKEAFFEANEGGARELWNEVLDEEVQRACSTGNFLKLDALKESAWILITKLQNLASNLIGRAANSIDNNSFVGPSMLRNADRFVIQVPLGYPPEIVAIFVTLLMFCTVMHFIPGIWYSFFKRDAWDSYFFKEGKILEKMQEALKVKCSLDSKSLRAFISILVRYEMDTNAFTEAINVATTKTVVAKKTAEKKNKKYQLLPQDEGGIKLKSVNTFFDVSDAPEDKEPGSILPSPIIIPLDDQSAKPNEPIPFLQRAKNWLVDFTEKFPGSSGFNTVFAFAWNYWFVFYYLTWGVAGAAVGGGLFAAVPPAFGLLALIGPVIYLVYKEYIAYTTWSVANEQSLNDEDKKRLETVDEKQRKEELKKILSEKADDATQFRYGWIFVAAIAGVAVGVACTLPLLPAIFIGIGVFAGILLISIGIGAILSRKAAIKREELIDDTSKRFNMVIKEKPRKEWAYERKGLLKKALRLVTKLPQQKTLQQTFIENTVKRIVTLKFESDEVEVVKHEEAVKEKLRDLMSAAEQKIQNRIGNTERYIEENKQQKKLKVSDPNVPDTTKPATNNTIGTIRKWMGAILDFFTGYMMICLTAFSVLDWVGVIISSIFLGGAPIVLVETIGGAVVVGILALFGAVAFSRATWKAEEEYMAEVEKIRQDPVYIAKKEKIDFFKEKILSLKKELEEDLSADVVQPSEEVKSKELLNYYSIRFGEVKKLIEKPAKKREYNFRWFVKKYLLAADGSLHVASALLIVRAVLLMGFMAAIPALNATGVLFLFGSAALTTNPIGITVLVLAGVLLLARLVRQFYLERQKVKELKQLHRVDEKLENKQSEYERLLYAEALIKSEKKLISGVNKLPEQKIREENEEEQPISTKLYNDPLSKGKHYDDASSSNSKDTSDTSDTSTRSSEEKEFSESDNYKKEII